MNIYGFIATWLLLGTGSLKTAKVKEVPVFNLNFYLMGQSEVDQSITVRIGENVEYLNQEFEGFIKFRINALFMDQGHAYIPDIHQKIHVDGGSMVEDLVGEIEKKGGINIFLFDTYTKGQNQPAMLGFTPILSMGHSSYEFNSPLFDRMFIAYPGLFSGSTIVHEMGHFLGLSHPWEMNKLDRQLMGLCQCSADDTNHMTYNQEVDHFTAEQLERMHLHAMSFRQYLMSHIELQY